MSTVALPAVRASPTTIQYALPKTSAKIRPIYPVKFYPNDRIKATLSQPWLKQTDPLMPKYPYKVNPHFAEASYGLYGGQEVQSGHKISKGRNKGKTNRKWYPNVRSETITSEALGETLTLPITARTMRTIRKCGGLDAYLLKDKPARLKELGLLGWKLRWLVLKSQLIRDQHAAERRELGLDSSEFSAESTFAHVWKDAASRKKILNAMSNNYDAMIEMKQRSDKALRPNGRVVRHVSRLDHLTTLHPTKMADELDVEVVETPVPFEETIVVPRTDDKKIRNKAVEEQVDLWRNGPKMIEAAEDAEAVVVAEMQSEVVDATNEYLATDTTETLDKDTGVSEEADYGADKAREINDADITTASVEDIESVDGQRKDDKL